MSRHLHQGAPNRKMLIAALVDCANACTNSDKPTVGCRGDSRPGDRSIDSSRMPRRSDNAGPGPLITAETVLRGFPIPRLDSGHQTIGQTARRIRQRPRGTLPLVSNGYLRIRARSPVRHANSRAGAHRAARCRESQRRSEGVGDRTNPTEHRFATAARAGDLLGNRIAWRAMQPSIDPQVGHNLCWCTIRQYKRIGHTIGQGIGHTIGQWHLARSPQIARRGPLVQNFGMAYGGPRWMTSAQWRERMPCS